MILLSLAILIISIILHEVAHGYMANWLGDPTARLQGRLTLNPISHIDPVGSILLPALLVFTHSPILIGYAKPVPYNPYNLSGKYDEALVAASGPGTNILLAVIFGLALRFFGVDLDTNIQLAFALIVITNLWLAIFNLLPIPPLDGSKVLSILLPGPLSDAYENLRRVLEGMGVLGGTLLILLIMYYVLSPILVMFLGTLFTLLTGAQL